MRQFWFVMSYVLLFVITATVALPVGFIYVPGYAAQTGTSASLMPSHYKDRTLKIDLVTARRSKFSRLVGSGGEPPTLFSLYDVLTRVR